MSVELLNTIGFVFSFIGVPVIVMGFMYLVFTWNDNFDDGE